MRLHHSSSSIPQALLLVALCIPLTLFATGRPAQTENKPAATQTSTGELHPVLVELFTSEGCSSCPPADLLVQRMDTVQPIPGAQLIVLSEHVTYWDHDGWKDPNSSSLLTARQDSYEAALGVKSLYTPQLIIDGAQSVQMSDAQKLFDTLQKAAAEPKLALKIGDVAVDPANPSVLHTHIETDVNAGKHNADVFVAVALDHVESQVLHGENGGHRLTHVAVVQQLVKVGKLSKGKSFSQDVRLQLGAGVDPGNVRLVAFAQESGPGKLLGAAMKKSVK